MLAKGCVVSNDRTLWYTDNMSLKEVIADIHDRNLTINVTRTFRIYGLKFNDERSFTSKYRSEFNLSKDKSMWDISLKELILYRDLLIGYSVKGYK